MSISLFFTPQNTTGAAQLASGGSAGGVQGASGVDFMEFLLALATQNENETSEAEEIVEDLRERNNIENSLLNSDNPALDVAELLSAAPEIEQDLKQLTETLDLTLEEQVAMALSLNQSVFDKLSLPEEFTQETREIILEKQELEAELQSVLENKETLNALLAGLQSLNNVEAFDLTRLTPQQFATLQSEIEQQIAANVSQDDDGVPVGFQAALTQLLNIINTPAAATHVTALPASLTKVNGSSDAEMLALAQRLNALEVGGGDALAGKNALPLTAPTEDGLSEFDLLLKTLDEQTKGAQPEQILSQLKKVSPDGATTHVLPELTSLIASGAGAALTSTFASFDKYFEQFNASHSPLNALQSLSSTITQGQSAGQSQPATQLVAITMQKMGTDGKDRTFTLRLDPPKLGQVEVKMSFNKDKTMKALLVIEKPETFAMLQRDAQALERAMQEIGLNADGGLSFELAQDGHDFNQDGRHDGTRNNTSGGQNDDTPEDLDLIESTMTWQVDPETGHMRYDILV